MPLSLVLHAAAIGLFVPRAAAKPPPPDPPPQLAGDTFELPAPDMPEIEEPSPAAPSASPNASSDEPGAPADDDAPAEPRSANRPAPHAPRAARSSPRATPGETNAETGSAPPGSVYGAVGDRSAADLATAFTRGFPQAASADPIWRTAPFGSAGDALVILTLDESGHIASEQVTGTPSPALSAGIRRTMALIRGRPFIAHGKLTKLHITAIVSPDTVHDGLHGDVFAIGGSFAGGEGNAFFALAIGRRVDLRARAK